MQCPKCKCELTPTGEVESAGRRLTVYQCDRCTLPWDFDGQVFDAALTFAVDGAGRLFDPSTMEPLSLN